MGDINLGQCSVSAAGLQCGGRSEADKNSIFVMFSYEFRWQHGENNSVVETGGFILKTRLPERQRETDHTIVSPTDFVQTLYWRVCYDVTRWKVYGSEWII